MIDRDMEAECRALAQWAERRGLEIDELMTICSLIIGRGIAAHIHAGMPLEDAMAVADKVRWQLFEGAGLLSKGEGGPDDGGNNSAKH